MYKTKTKANENKTINNKAFYNVNMHYAWKCIVKVF